MPRYLLSVYQPAEPTDSDHAALTEAVAGALTGRLQRDGHLVFAGGLEPVTTATTVDAPDGTAAFIDGPYRELPECLGGVWVIEAVDLDVALTLAAEGTKVCHRPVEVRPFRAERPGRARPDH